MAEQLSPAEQKVVMGSLRNAAEDVLIFLAGNNYQQMWDMTENLSVAQTNKIIATMLKKIDSQEQFAIDIGTLLKAYIINKMSVINAKNLKPNLAILFNRYDIKEGGPLSEDTVTLPRLSMAFPYESAVIRSLHEGESRLLPYVKFYPNRDDKCTCFGKYSKGDDEVIRFPFAGLIIPSSWNVNWKYWEKWYRNFIEFKLDGPLPLPLEIRLQTQIEAMKQRAVINDRQNIIKMQALNLRRLCG